MADDVYLAPSTSRRPIGRHDRQKARESRSYARGVDDESLRALLEGNALRQLGYETAGGIGSLFPVSGIPERGQYYSQGYNIEVADRDIREDAVYGGQRFKAMTEAAGPERTEAFETMQSETLLPPRSIALGENYNTPVVASHELGHAGMTALRDMFQRNPEKVDRYLGDLSFAELNEIIEGPQGGRLRGLEEAVVELSDDPNQTWWTPTAEERTLEPTIQMLQDAELKARAKAFDEALQLLASEELARLRMGP